MVSLLWNILGQAISKGMGYVSRQNIYIENTYVNLPVIRARARARNRNR